MPWPKTNKQEKSYPAPAIGDVDSLQKHKSLSLSARWGIKGLQQGLISSSPNPCSFHPGSTVRLGFKASLLLAGDIGLSPANEVWAGVRYASARGTCILCIPICWWTSMPRTAMEPTCWRWQDHHQPGFLQNSVQQSPFLSSPSPWLDFMWG